MLLAHIHCIWGHQGHAIRPADGLRTALESRAALHACKQACVCRNLAEAKWSRCCREADIGGRWRDWLKLACVYWRGGRKAKLAGSLFYTVQRPQAKPMADAVCEFLDLMEFMRAHVAMGSGAVYPRGAVIVAEKNLQLLATVLNQGQR